MLDSIPSNSTNDYIGDPNFTLPENLDEILAPEIEDKNSDPENLENCLPLHVRQILTGSIGSFEADSRFKLFDGLSQISDDDDIEMVKTGTSFEREQEKKVGAKKKKDKKKTIFDKNRVELEIALSNWYDRKLQAEEEIARYLQYLNKIDQKKDTIVVKFLGPRNEGDLPDMFLCRKLHQFNSFPPEELQKDDLVENVNRTMSYVNFGSTPQQNWFESIIDLIFVTFIIKLSQQMFWTHVKDAMDNKSGGYIVRGLFESAVLFTAFFSVWLEGTLCMARFTKANEYFPLTVSSEFGLILLYAFGLLYMAILIQTDDFLFSGSQGFMAGFCTCCTSFLGFYLFYYKFVPTAEIYAKKRCLIFGIAAFCSMMAAWDPAEQTWVVITILIITSFCILLIELNSLRVHIDFIPVYIEHLSYQVGNLFAIVLGETVINLALIDINNHTTTTSIAVGCCFLVVFLIYDQYAKSHVKDEYHALAQEKSPGALAWMFLHLPLCFSVIVMGVGFKLAVSELQDNSDSDALSRVYGVDCHEEECFRNSSYLTLFFMPISIGLVWLLRCCHAAFELSAQWPTKTLRPLVLLGSPMGLAVLATIRSPLGECFFTLFYTMVIWGVDYHSLITYEFINDFDRTDITRIVNQNKLIFRSEDYFGSGVRLRSEHNLAGS